MVGRRGLLKWVGNGFLRTPAAGIWMTRPGAVNPYYVGPVTDHFDGCCFFNPGGTPPGKFTDLIRWKLNGKKAVWPDRIDSPFHGLKPDLRVSPDAVAVTLVGHATFLIQFGALNLLTDPVWSERASPISFAGPKRVNPPAIAYKDLPKIDAVLLTHSHYDHMDVETLARLVADHDPLIVTPIGNDGVLKNDLPITTRFQVGDWHDVAYLNGKVRVHFEPCHHWSARGLRDRCMVLWSAFTIEATGAKLYHIGDTGFHDGINYRALREKHGDIDLAILPIGAYEPRWFMAANHMNPTETVKAFQDLRARRMMIVHWGTFRLGDEPVHFPPIDIRKALEAADIRDRLVDLPHGQTYNFAAF